jgi:hypothetical protein
MRKITYGIAGFAAGIMLGLLIGLAEMRIFKGLQHSSALPFLIGTTVIISAITGVSLGIRKAKRDNGQ